MPGALLQRWHLVGLQPMHDAMIRRLANEECDLIRKECHRDISIAWGTSEHFDSWTDWAGVEGFDVLIATADKLVKLIGNAPTTAHTLLTGTVNQSCLRLVWSGLNGMPNDTAWATEWLAHGAIVDPRSLQSWIRIAVRKARTIPKPPHPFLRHLELPSS